MTGGPVLDKAGPPGSWAGIELDRRQKVTLIWAAIAVVITAFEGSVLVIALPLINATRGLIGKRELAAMKPSAWLINISRGPVIGEQALLAALRERRIAGAVLDVFDTEPLPADHPLWALDNVVVTPHIAGPSIPAKIAPVFNDNLRRYLAGRPLRYVVDRKRGY